MRKRKLGKERLLNQHEKNWAFFPFQNKQWKQTLEQQQYVEMICIMSLHIEILVTKSRLKRFCNPFFFHVVAFEMSPKFELLNKI